MTNSIQNTISGNNFQTEVSRLPKADLKQITKKNGWWFNWKLELDNNTKEVYKLTIVNNPNIIQGLMSISIENDHLFMNLVESAQFNIGKSKLYEGVAENLVGMLVKFHFKKALTDLPLLTQRLNSFPITKRH